MIFLIFLSIFILGAAIGSFLNVLIGRLPKGEKITGRSHCDHCRKKLRWYDLIPILSFFILDRKCRYCHKKLSWQYPIVEIITGISFVLITNYQIPITRQFSNIRSLGNWSLFGYWLLVIGLLSSFIVIFFSDLNYHLISDYVLITLFIFSFFYKLFNNVTIQQFSNFFLSGLIVALPIFLIYYFSKERAMGLGDVYLSTIIGFLLGWKRGYLALYIAVITGAIFGLVLIVLKKKKLQSKIAFGPFIVIGTIVMLFWGEKIMEIIKKIYGF